MPNPKASQLMLEMPIDKRETRITVMLNGHDVQVLKRSMRNTGETNMSSYIRRLIHENKKGD